MHPNAKLTLTRRAEMITDLQRYGLMFREAAASRNISEKASRRWFARVREEGFTERVFERSCVPKLQRRRTFR
jgi:transposase